jgi:hypothetical protein
MFTLQHFNIEWTNLLKNVIVPISHLRSEANLLALGSEDRTLSISNVEGDTLRVATLRAEPSDIQFSEMKQVPYFFLAIFFLNRITVSLIKILVLMFPHESVPQDIF